MNVLKIALMFLCSVSITFNGFCAETFDLLHMDSEPQNQNIDYPQLPALSFMNLDLDLDFSKRFEMAFQPNQDYQYFKRINEQSESHKNAENPVFKSWIAAELSLLSYNTPSFIDFTLLKNGFTNTRHFYGASKDGQAFITTLKNSVFVCYRGTEPGAFKDAVTDLTFYMTDFADKGKVHSGFSKSYIELEAAGIKEYLQTIIMAIDPEEIIFCGHSLGGALATLAAASYPERGFLITFGSPRVGNYKFSRLFKTKGLRFANLMDPVSHVPPALALIGSYRHVGTAVHLLRSKLEYKEPDPRQWSFNSLSEIKEHLIGQSEDLFDHSPLYYALKLRTAYFNGIQE